MALLLAREVSQIGFTWPMPSSLSPKATVFKRPAEFGGRGTWSSVFLSLKMRLPSWDEGAPLFLFGGDPSKRRLNSLPGSSKGAHLEIPFASPFRRIRGKWNLPLPPPPTKTDVSSKAPRKRKEWIPVDLGLQV